MEIQQKYTVAEATKFLGFKSRSTINARTQAQGNTSISFDIDENGNKIISIHELERAFPDKYKTALKRTKNTYSTQFKNTENAQSNTAKNTNILEVKIEMLEQQLEYERKERAHDREDAKKREAKAEEREKDLSAKLDKAQSTIEKQTYLISDMREKTIEKPTERPKGFFGMFSRAGG